VKSCRVWFRDRQGVEHGVYVQALSRFHAFGLALHQMRRCTWSNPDHSGVQQMTVEILEKWSSQKKIAVPKADFDAWLQNRQENLQEEKARKHLRMLLGLDPPDRDFKRGRSAR
jgi:hypothetical protein